MRLAVNLPAPPTCRPQSYLARLEQIAHLTFERPTQLAQRLERGVLTGTLQSCVRWTADAKSTGHLNLREVCLSSHATQ